MENFLIVYVFLFMTIAGEGCLPSPGAHEPAYLYMIAKLKKNFFISRT